MDYNEYIDVSPEVSDALSAGKAVVALESTIIAHGMPFPKNIESARRCGDVIRENGAVPATVAMIGGRIKIGLADEDLLHLASAQNVMKLSRRDIGYAIARGRDGATTVAATMIFAERAGIRVFATGGIGGVHRQAQQTFDISADLQELAHTDVCVVCAGAKSILDLRLTMEYLETMGVPVFGYQTDRLPAFYTRSSGIELEQRVESPAEVARAMKAKWELGIRGGAVVGVPIPEEYAQREDVIDPIIEEAVRDAERRHVSGKEITPFLLARISEKTGGDSLNSNIALVLNNCAVAAQIAVEYCRLLGH